MKLVKLEYAEWLCRGNLDNNYPINEGWRRIFVRDNLCWQRGTNKTITEFSKYLKSVGIKIF